jgi:hypothetical protein
LEVARSLAYMAHRYQSWHFNRLALSGDGANLPGLRERLTTELQVQVSVGCEGSGIAPALLLASGAAKHAGTLAREAA